MSYDANQGVSGDYPSEAWCDDCDPPWWSLEDTRELARKALARHNRWHDLQEGGNDGRV